MSQRNSGYERKPYDLYETAPVATYSLLDNFQFRPRIVEPAVGGGKIFEVLDSVGYAVFGSDIVQHYEHFKPDLIYDFLSDDSTYPGDIERYDIITNPPFGQRGELAERFIEKSLRLTQRSRGAVAMLLRSDFDHAKSRWHLFGGCPQFAGTVVLNYRINWLEKEGGERPSENHKWFVWDWKNRFPPVVRYSNRDPKAGAIE